MVAILPPEHKYEQNEHNDLPFCKCGVAKKLHMPPKTNEEWVEEFETFMTSLVIKTLRNEKVDERQEVLAWLRTLLTTKDKEREEAVAEAFSKGQKVGHVSIVSHMITEYGLPFERISTKAPQP